MTGNNLSEIKKLMKIVGGKVVIVEDGKPTMVIINIDEYARLDLKKDDSKKERTDNLSNDLSDKKLVEKINRNINIWKNRQEERKLKQLEENSYEKIERESKNHEEEKKVNEEIVIEKL